MSSSSSMLLTDYKQVGQAVQKQHPEWLKVLLERSFFEACLAHPIRRNEVNKYCISCKESACQYCMSSGAHRHHRVLNIYRHVYKDVVSLSAMDNYFDCSQIQPYKCNKRMVIALNPLPHSGQSSNIGASCEVCKRRLTEPGLYHYCSITCKVMAFSRKSRDSSSPPFHSIHSPNKKNQRNNLKPEKPMHKRKGKPCRAPLF